MISLLAVSLFSQFALAARNNYFDDVDNDGDLDFYLDNLIINDLSNTNSFYVETDFGGIGNLSENFTVIRGYFGDFNADDREDLIVVTNVSNFLYISNGNGKFTNTTPSNIAGISTHAVAVLDADNDGADDLFIDSNLFLGNDDGTFTNVTGLANLNQTNEIASLVQIFPIDLNIDERAGLTTDSDNFTDLVGIDNSGNVLVLLNDGDNNGDGVPEFVDITELAGLNDANDGAFVSGGNLLFGDRSGSTVLDFFEDIFISRNVTDILMQQMTLADSSGVPQSGIPIFQAVSHTNLTAGGAGTGTTHFFSDIDNNGWLDIYVGKNGSDVVLLRFDDSNTMAFSLDQNISNSSIVNNTSKFAQLASLGLNNFVDLGIIEDAELLTDVSTAGDSVSSTDPEGSGVFMISSGDGFWATTGLTFSDVPPSGAGGGGSSGGSTGHNLDQREACVLNEYGVYGYDCEEPEELPQPEVEKIPTPSKPLEPGLELEPKNCIDAAHVTDEGKPYPGARVKVFVDDKLTHVSRTNELGVTEIGGDDALDDLRWCDAGIQPTTNGYVTKTGKVITYEEIKEENRYFLVVPSELSAFATDDNRFSLQHSWTYLRPNEEDFLKVQALLKAGLGPNYLNKLTGNAILLTSTDIPQFGYIHRDKGMVELPSTSPTPPEMGGVSFTLINPIYYMSPIALAMKVYEFAINGDIDITEYSTITYIDAEGNNCRAEVKPIGSNLFKKLKKEDCERGVKQEPKKCEDSEKTPADPGKKMDDDTRTCPMPPAQPQPKLPTPQKPKEPAVDDKPLDEPPSLLPKDMPCEDKLDTLWGMILEETQRRMEIKDNIMYNRLLQTSPLLDEESILDQPLSVPLSDLLKLIQECGCDPYGNAVRLILETMKQYYEKEVMVINIIKTETTGPADLARLEEALRTNLERLEEIEEHEKLIDQICPKPDFDPEDLPKVPPNLMPGQKQPGVDPVKCADPVNVQDANLQQQAIRKQKAENEFDKKQLENDKRKLDERIEDLNIRWSLLSDYRSLLLRSGVDRDDPRVKAIEQEMDQVEDELDNLEGKLVDFEDQIKEKQQKIDDLNKQMQKIAGSVLECNICQKCVEKADGPICQPCEEGDPKCNTNSCTTALFNVHGMTNPNCAAYKNILGGVSCTNVRFTAECRLRAKYPGLTTIKDGKHVLDKFDPPVLNSIISLDRGRDTWSGGEPISYDEPAGKCYLIAETPQPEVAQQANVRNSKIDYLNKLIDKYLKEGKDDLVKLLTDRISQLQSEIDKLKQYPWRKSLVRERAPDGRGNNELIWNNAVPRVRSEGIISSFVWKKQLIHRSSIYFHAFPWLKIFLNDCGTLCPGQKLPFGGGGGNKQPPLILPFPDHPGGTCGNGILESIEQCDDGNLINGDGCDSLCRLEQTQCGDGIIDIGEQCGEPGLSCLPGEVCSQCGCQPAPTGQCGDGAINFGEQCGEPGLSCGIGQTCTNCACGPLQPGICGDGVINLGEQCGEPGLSCNPGEQCISCGCQPLVPGICGDGVVNLNEECGEPGLSCSAGETCSNCGCTGTAGGEIDDGFDGFGDGLCAGAYKCSTGPCVDGYQDIYCRDSSACRDYAGIPQGPQLPDLYERRICPLQSPTQFQEAAGLSWIWLLIAVMLGASSYTVYKETSRRSKAPDELDAYLNWYKSRHAKMNKVTVAVLLAAVTIPLLLTLYSASLAVPVNDVLVQQPVPIDQFAEERFVEIVSASSYEDIIDMMEDHYSGKDFERLRGYTSLGYVKRSELRSEFGNIAFELVDQEVSLPFEVQSKYYLMRSSKTRNVKVEAQPRARAVPVESKGGLLNQFLVPGMILVGAAAAGFATKSYRDTKRRKKFEDEYIKSLKKKYHVK